MNHALPYGKVPPYSLILENGSFGGRMRVPSLLYSLGLAAVLGMGMLFTVFLSSSLSEKPVHAATEKIPLVAANKIQLTETSDLLVYPAKVESKIHSVILAETDGVVRQIITLGTPVKRGTTLMSLKQSDPVYQYAPVQVQSPVQGVVSEIFVSEGAQVVRGAKLASVVDPDQIRISLEIPDSELTKIKQGQKGTFLTKLGSQEIKAEVEVSGVSPLVNTLTGTATAILTFKDKSQLKAGSIGRVEFKLDPAQKIMVDETAIVYRNAKPFVRVIEEEMAKYKAVTLGPRQNGKIVIEEGLKEGETIIQRASQYIPENKKVKIQE